MNIIIYSAVIALAIVAVICAYLSGYWRGADEQYIASLENELAKYETLFNASDSNIKPISLDELKEIVDEHNKDDNDGGNE